MLLSAPVNFGQRPLSSPTVFNFFLPDHHLGRNSAFKLGIDPKELR